MKTPRIHDYRYTQVRHSDDKRLFVSGAIFSGKNGKAVVLSIFYDNNCE
ncbi:MAG: hypothetical protein HQK83_01440 [Fibrobacteria bacterium]|nr:hypothetical protein [Fibrobacteria bacterium]